MVTVRVLNPARAGSRSRCLTEVSPPLRDAADASGANADLGRGGRPVPLLTVLRIEDTCGSSTELGCLDPTGRGTLSPKPISAPGDLHQHELTGFPLERHAADYFLVDVHAVALYVEEPGACAVPLGDVHDAGRFTIGIIDRGDHTPVTSAEIHAPDLGVRSASSWTMRLLTLVSMLSGARNGRTRRTQSVALGEDARS